MDLFKKYIRPTKRVKEMAESGFKVGFQIRSHSELVSPLCRVDSNPIIDFIDSVNYPVFIAADTQQLTERLMTNPKVFGFQNPNKYKFAKEWDWSLAELITLSRCDVVYLTGGSTYGEMAYLLSDKDIIVRDINEGIHPDEENTIKKSTVI